MNLDDIKAKLRALRSKTVANGCTEEEALAAAEKAAELLSRHGLTDDDLADADYDTIMIDLGRRTPLDHVWLAIARFANCAGYLDRTGTGHKFCFFGREQDVLVAEYIYDVMKGAMDRAVAEFRASAAYTKRRTRRTRNAAVKAFLEGAAIALCNKLYEGLWRRYDPAWQTRGRELALVDQKRIETKLGETIRTGPVRDLAPAEGRFRADARTAGWVAGKKVEVNAGVAAGHKVVGVLK